MWTQAHDYFDDNLEQMFNELRKYRAGLIIAHQNLGQLSKQLKDTVMASTKTQMIGGLSTNDAADFARAMGRGPAVAHVTEEKGKDSRTFAVRVKNHDLFGSNKIPFGMLESRRKTHAGRQ